MGCDPYQKIDMPIINFIYLFTSVVSLQEAEQRLSLSFKVYSNGSPSVHVYGCQQKCWMKLNFSLFGRIPYFRQETK